MYHSAGLLPRSFNRGVLRTKKSEMLASATLWSIHAPQTRGVHVGFFSFFWELETKRRDGALNGRIVFRRKKNPTFFTYYFVVTLVAPIMEFWRRNQKLRMHLSLHFSSFILHREKNNYFFYVLLCSNFGGANHGVLETKLNTPYTFISIFLSFILQFHHERDFMKFYGRQGFLTLVSDLDWFETLKAPCCSVGLIFCLII